MRTCPLRTPGPGRRDLLSLPHVDKFNHSAGKSLGFRCRGQVEPHRLVNRPLLEILATRSAKVLRRAGYEMRLHVSRQARHENKQAGEAGIQNPFASLVPYIPLEGVRPVRGSLPPRDESAGPPCGRPACRPAASERARSMPPRSSSPSFSSLCRSDLGEVVGWRARFAQKSPPPFKPGSSLRPVWAEPRSSATSIPSATRPSSGPASSRAVPARADPLDWFGSNSVRCIGARGRHNF